MIDFDGGGSVDYDEFIVTCITPEMILHSTNLSNMFDILGPTLQESNITLGTTMVISASNIRRMFKKFMELDVGEATWARVLLMENKFEPNRKYNL